MDSPAKFVIGILAGGVVLAAWYFLSPVDDDLDNDMGAAMCGRDDANQEDKERTTTTVMAPPTTSSSTTLPPSSTTTSTLQAPAPAPSSTPPRSSTRANSSKNVVVVVRAAFDVGSGSTKVAVATIEVSSKNSKHLSTGVPMLEEEREVLMKHALLPDGSLPKEATDLCFSVLQEYVERARKLGATEYIGVATAVFREATNGQMFLNRVRTELGIDLFVASQVFEGTIGWRTAAQAARGGHEEFVRRSPSKRRRPSGEYGGGGGGGGGGGETKRGRSVGRSTGDMDGVQVLSWDSGGGSFQISNSRGDMYGGQVGSSTSLQIMMELQGRPFQAREKAQEKGAAVNAAADVLSVSSRPSANPCTLADCRRLHERLASKHMPPVDGWLQTLMDGGRAFGFRTVAIGGETCAFAMCEAAIGKSTFGPEDVWSSIEHLVGMDDQSLLELSFLQPEMLLPKLVLVYTVMKHVGIVEAEYHVTTGSTLGLLCTPMEEMLVEKGRVKR